MWTIVSSAIVIVSFCTVVVRVAQTRDGLLAFVVFSVWSRMMLSAFPALSVPPRLLGFSINAIAGLLVVAIGLLIIRKRHFLHISFVPLYIFLAVVLFSGVINWQIQGFVETLLRFMYLIVLQAALIVAIERNGTRSVLTSLVVVFFLPVGLQLASIVLRHGTASEDSEGISYIGGYQQESGFAMVMLALTAAAGLWETRHIWVKWLAIGWGIAGLVFANYRTAIIGSFPLIFVLLVGAVLGRFYPHQRRLAGALFALLVVPAVGLGMLLAPQVSDRLSAVVEILEVNVFKNPIAFTREEQDLLTGRAYIWSMYLDGFSNGSLVQKAVGHGPNSWEDRFPKYAHNTYISFLYEFGVIGLAAFMAYLVFLLVLCARVQQLETRWRLLAAYVGFCLLNMATMPLWQISGLLLLAILNAIAAHAAFLPKTAPYLAPNVRAGSKMVRT